MDKIVITAALTGSWTVKGDKKGQTPYLPITPDELAEEAKRAYDEGAAVVHLHARDPKTDAPSADLKIFAEIVEKIKAKCDIIINTTTGGGVGMTDEERIAIVPEVKPDMASLNCGSMSYGIWGGKPGEWAIDVPWANSFKSIEFYARTMMENNCKPEIEIYDVAMMNAAKILIDAEAIKPPPHFQFVMGLPGQVIPATGKNLIHLAETAQTQFPGCTYSVCAAGVSEFPMITMGAIIGCSNVRVGLEDNIYIKRGVLAKSNGELVKKAVDLVEGVGREIASVTEAREIFGLK